MMVETATPQRPALPVTPFTTKTSLPPLSSILNNPGMESTNRPTLPGLPSLDTYSTPLTSKYYSYPMSGPLTASASTHPYLPFATPSKSPYSAYPTLPSLGMTVSTPIAASAANPIAVTAITAPAPAIAATAPVVPPPSSVEAVTTSATVTAAAAPLSNVSPTLLAAASSQTSTPSASPTLKVQSATIASRQTTTSSNSSESSKKGRKRTSDKSYAFISHSPATFPSQEPSIDNVPLARRKRRRTSPNELSILNSEFELGSTPNKSRRLEIASRVTMSEKAVQIWFQNKRQSLRKASSNEKEVTELPPTPPISMLLQSGPISPSTSMPGSASGITPHPVENSLSRSHSIPHMSFGVPIYRQFNHSSPNIALSEATPNVPSAANSSFDSSYDNTFHDKENLPKLNVKSILGDESFASESKTSSQKSPIKLAPVRKPLGDITTNSTNGKPKKESECIQNLLSLRAGTWK